MNAPFLPSPLRRLLARVAAGCVLATAALPAPVLACATCFGQSDSPMAKGMNAGIFMLLCCIMAVLAAIAVFFFYILRRASRMAGLTAPGEAAPSHPQPTHS